MINKSITNLKKVRDCSMFVTETLIIHQGIKRATQPYKGYTKLHGQIDQPIPIINLVEDIRRQLFH